jgi:uncharacterized protein (DUF2141 family)
MFSRTAFPAAFVHACAFFPLLAAASVAWADGPPATSTVDINVGSFRNDKGWLGCRLYSSPTGFPKEPSPLEQRVAIAGKVTRCTFSSVAPGTYAVAVMHDENANGRLDTNFLGIPTEGYGVSNNHTHAMSAPTWDESRFVVAPGQDVRLGVALHY